jgi:hypothetical protein
VEALEVGFGESGRQRWFRLMTDFRMLSETLPDEPLLNLASK